MISFLGKQPRRLACSLRQLNGLLIERHKCLCPEPLAFVRDDAIGKIATLVKCAKTGVHGGPVHHNVCAGQNTAECLCYVGAGKLISP